MKVNIFISEAPSQDQGKEVFENVVSLLGILQDADEIKTKKSDIIYGMHQILSNPVASSLPKESLDPLRRVLTNEAPLESSGELLVSALVSIQDSFKT